MERRKFLIGIGSLAAGAAAATGTGAFTAMSATRGSTINVTSDDSALIALSDTPESGEIIQQNGQGELVIDFAASDNADGVNPNSRYQIGEVEANEAATNPVYNDFSSNTPYDQPAFNVTNQSSEEREVKLEYTTNSVDEDTNTKLMFLVQDEDMDNDGGGSNGQTNVIKVGKNRYDNIIETDSTTVTLSAGERAGVSIYLETGSEADNLSGALTVSVNEETP